MMLSVHLVVPATIDNKKYSEWREILVKAANTTSVRNAYKVDFCVPMDQMADKEIDQWFNNQVVFWKNMTTGVVLEK
jgi:tripartite-type tricarboxylate transporter receptor subunit TctC